VFVNPLSKSLRDGGTAKASLNRAPFSSENRGLANDPKPSELAMARMKFNES
jgi:hypothetical protein